MLRPSRGRTTTRPPSPPKPPTVGRAAVDAVGGGPPAPPRAGGRPRADPGVLEPLVAAAPPPLLAFVVIVHRVGAEGVGDRVRVGRLRQLHAAGQLEDPAIAIG